jgi:MFS family permease
LQKTGSATLFASMLAISILPRIILSPIAGVFGDWFNRKKTIVMLDFINTIVLLVFGAIMLWTNDLSIGLIYLLIIILETTEIFFDSAMSAVLPSIIEKNNLLEANSFRTTIISFGQLMAPVLGALIFGVFGLLVAILINAVSYLLSAISELFIRIPKTTKDTPNKSLKVFKEDLIEDLRVVKKNKSIRTIISVALLLILVFLLYFQWD